MKENPENSIRVLRAELVRMEGDALRFERPQATEADFMVVELAIACLVAETRNKPMPKTPTTGEEK